MEREVVESDMDDLHLKPNDGMDCGSRREMMRGNLSDATAMMMLMLRAEYQLYISGAVSRRLTWT